MVWVRKFFVCIRSINIPVPIKYSKYSCSYKIQEGGGRKTNSSDLVGEKGKKID